MRAKREVFDDLIATLPRWEEETVSEQDVETED
jgi:hypothetical protein